LVADKYVSSKYSVCYHKTNFKEALRIDPLIKVIYNSSEEAQEGGKRPCQACKSPVETFGREKKLHGN
jgi:methylphosphotriester-DNA--protein-cysteine methyltransferase